MRTPDVVGRSTTARPRGWTLRHRGAESDSATAPTGSPTAERGDNLSGRASETEKGPSQGALFRFTVSPGETSGTPDDVGRSTTACQRGRTSRHRGRGAIPRWPRRGAAERSGGAPAVQLRSKISPGAPSASKVYLTRRPLNFMEWGNLPAQPIIATFRPRLPRGI